MSPATAGPVGDARVTNWSCRKHEVTSTMPQGPLATLASPTTPTGHDDSHVASLHLVVKAVSDARVTNRPDRAQRAQARWRPRRARARRWRGRDTPSGVRVQNNEHEYEATSTVLQGPSATHASPTDPVGRGRHKHEGGHAEDLDHAAWAVSDTRVTNRPGRTRQAQTRRRPRRARAR